MSISLAQLLGGLFGIAVAYTWYYFDDKKDQRVLEELAKRHKADLEAIRKQVSKR